jgi:hypothetical protein
VQLYPFTVVLAISASLLTGGIARLFDEVGGYDDGMIQFGGFEPEFSVRAWKMGSK